MALPNLDRMSSATQPPDYTSIAPEPAETVDPRVAIPVLSPNRRRISTDPPPSSTSPTSILVPLGTVLQTTIGRRLPAPARNGRRAVEPYDVKYDSDVNGNVSTSPRQGTSPNSEDSAAERFFGLDSPDARPPTYIDGRHPTEPITYTLRQASPNSMILLPPEDSADSRPLYHISVAMDCFCPESYITTIQRGSGESDDIVGEFEMGGPVFKETVFIRGDEYPLHTVMTMNRTDEDRISFTCNVPGKRIIWFPGIIRPPGSTTRKRDGAKLPVPTVCSSIDRTKTYAKFYPATELRERGAPRVLNRLKVEPVVHQEKMMDDIVLTCLVVERWRWLMMMGRK